MCSCLDNTKLFYEQMTITWEQFWGYLDGTGYYGSDTRLQSGPSLVAHVWIGPGYPTET